MQNYSAVFPDNEQACRHTVTMVLASERSGSGSGRKRAADYFDAAHRVGHHPLDIETRLGFDNLFQSRVSFGMGGYEQRAAVLVGATPTTQSAKLAGPL